jgi:hypothetical protein
MDEGQRWDVRDRTSSRVSGTASPNRTHCRNLLRYGSLLGNEHDSLSGSANLDMGFECNRLWVLKKSRRLAG